MSCKTLFSITFAALLFLFWQILPASGWALTVVAVQSKGHLPYEQVWNGLKSELQGLSLNLVVLDEPAALRASAETFHGSKPDMVLCMGSESLDAVMAIRDIPKVFCMVTRARADQVQGREDVWGVVIDLPASLQFKVLREAFPKHGRIGVMYDPHSSGPIIAEARSEASAFAFELFARPVASIKEVPSALDAMKGKVDLLWSIFDSTAYGHDTLKYVLLNSLKKDLPFVGYSPQVAKAGAVIALYGDYEDMGRQAGLLVRQLVQEKKPVERIVAPRKVRIAINNKVAEALKISFPAQFLQTVQEVY